MKKTFTRLAMVLALALAVACFSAVALACGNDEEKTYDVKVVYADGTPVNANIGINKYGSKTDVTVQICVFRDGALGDCLADTPSIGADGKASFGKLDTLPEGQAYHVQLNYLPEGYTYDETATFMTGPGTLTITVNKPE